MIYIYVNYIDNDTKRILIVELKNGTTLKKEMFKKVNWDEYNPTILEMIKPHTRQYKINKILNNLIYK